MREDRLIYKTIKSLEDFNEGQKVTSVQVHEAINACHLPQWLKAALIWLSAWTLKREVFLFPASISCYWRNHADNQAKIMGGYH